MEKINAINRVIEDYFEINKSIRQIPAKDLMPAFIGAGIFEKDHRSGLPIRKILKDLDANNQLHKIPFLFADRKLKNTNWYFQRLDVGDIPKTFAEEKKLIPATAELMAKKCDRDEDYVLDLCDQVLSAEGFRQHTFDFLRGDSGRKLPVDIYYKEFALVVEYREYQHTHAVKHFDKSDKLTVSGVHRGEQRRIYDQRRRDVLPTKGIRLIEINYTDFECKNRNRIRRQYERDVEIIKIKLTL